MDEAARCRRAARDAVGDVDPAALRDAIDDLLSESSVAAGALTLATARALGESVAADAVADRAAGVQLIYEGLGLTRRLAHEEPWAATADPADSDLDILAADVLVARGFYLLARTEAAGAAVETVRAFGSDQTRRRDPDADAAALDRGLERDVLELAIVAGATAVGVAPEDPGAVAADVAEGAGVPLGPAARIVPDAATLRARLAPSEPPIDGGGEPQSATDP